METRAKQLASELAIDFTRQRDWFDPVQSTHRVTIVGCGGIGSPTALLLSKLGIPYLTLVDDDVIEAHNLPNQFFPLKMVGKEKVNVLKAVCMMFGTSDVTPIVDRVENVPDALHGTVVTGLDSMEARKTVWNIVKKNKKVDYLVDGRLNGLGIQIWTIDVNNDDQIKEYEQWALYSDEEADDQPCTARAVIDVAGKVASLITTQVRLIATKQTPEMAISLRGNTLWTPYSTSTSKTSTTRATPSSFTAPPAEEVTALEEQEVTT